MKFLIIRDPFVKDLFEGRGKFGPRRVLQQKNKGEDTVGRFVQKEQGKVLRGNKKRIKLKGLLDNFDAGGELWAVLSPFGKKCVSAVDFIWERFSFFANLLYIFLLSRLAR